MLVAVAMMLQSTQALSAKDFVVLEPGTRWTYQESSGQETLTYEYAAEQKALISGQEATPIVVRYRGNPLSTTFYFATDDTYAIAAEDDSRRPTKPPRPVFKIGTEGSHWTYAGTVPFDTTEAPITMTGSSHLGKRTVLGTEVDTLEVTLDETMTPPKKKPMTMHVTAVYGKTFGLVEMSATSTIDGKTASQHLELVKIKRPGAPKG